jgi:hypothetical protein
MLSRFARAATIAGKTAAPAAASAVAALTPRVASTASLMAPLAISPARAHSSLAFRGSRAPRDWHQKKDPKTGELSYYNIFTKETTTVMPREYLAHDAVQESPFMRFVRNDQLGRLGSLGQNVNWRITGIFFAVMFAIIGAEVYSSRSNAPSEEEGIIDREMARRIQEDRDRIIAENQAMHYRRRPNSY